MSTAEIDTHRGETTRERILAAAELLFSESGFEGTATRKIAEAAGVTVGLVNYHFKSKDGLYRAVFERRSDTIISQRMAGLQLARLEPDTHRRAELVVRSMLVPVFQMRASAHNAAFGRLLVREVINPESVQRGIIRDLFDPVAQEVITTLASCYPEWSKSELHWAYQVMLGAMCQIISDAGRIERLSDGAASPQNADDAATNVCAILVAGFRHRARSNPNREITAP